MYDKPPIPPRGAPPVPQRQSSAEKLSSEVHLRQKIVAGKIKNSRNLKSCLKNDFTEDHYSNAPSNRPYSLQPQPRSPQVAQNGNSNGNGVEEVVWMKQETDGKSQAGN